MLQNSSPCRTRILSRTNWSCSSKCAQRQALTLALFLPLKKEQTSKMVSQRCSMRYSQRMKLSISQASSIVLAFIEILTLSDRQEKMQASAWICLCLCGNSKKWVVGFSQLGGVFLSSALQLQGIISLIIIKLRSMSTVPKGRIRIFDYWQIQEPSLESEPSVRRSGQSLIADDLITETQRIVSNVNQFMEGKLGFQNKFEHTRLQIEDLLGTLHAACNCEAEEQAAAEENLRIYRENLKKLYLSLRGAKLLLNRLETYFQTANLANYDRKATQLAFTEPSSAMEQRLKASLVELRRAMHLLIETQRLKDSGKELSSIFGKDSTPEYCLTRLQELLAHQNIVKLHFLMLYQLEEVQSLVDRLRQLINVAESEYLKYELVLDCVALMQIETAEMKAQLKEADRQLQSACSHPLEADARYLAAQGEAREESWKINRQIYQTNLQNFTRANVQTDMYYYSELKARFVAQLDEFIQVSQHHRPQMDSLVYLLDRQALLSDLRRRAGLLNKVGEADRKLARTIYNQTSNHAVPANCAPLLSLKEGLLSEIELFLVNNGIAYNKRAREQVPLEQDLQRYQNIIANIESLPIHEQYASISSHLQVINASVYQLQALLSDKARLLGKGSGAALENKVRTATSLRVALLYASVLGSSATFQQKLMECARIKEREGFEDMPVKFQETIFNYINDMRLIEDSRKRDEEVKRSLIEVEGAIKGSLTKSKLRGNLDNLLQKEFTTLKQAWFNLYHIHLRTISSYGQQLLQDRVAQICKLIAQSVRGLFAQEGKLIDPRTMDIDRKSFFSHRVLSQLADIANSNLVKTDSLRIVNVLRTLQQAFQALDRGFIDKSIGGKIAEIVKLFLLEQYLKKAYGEGNLWRAIRTLRSTAYLQSVAELYPSASLSKTAVLQALLQIQLQINASSLILPQRDELAPAITEKVQPLIKEMRRFQLTIAARHDVSGFVAIFRYTEIISQLQEVLGRSGITGVAQAFVCLQELRSARKAVDQRYQSYENVVVKGNKSIEQYFQRARAAFQPKIEGMSREMELALRSFLNRGESVSLARAVEALLKKS